MCKRFSTKLKFSELIYINLSLYNKMILFTFKCKLYYFSLYVYFIIEFFFVKNIYFFKILYIIFLYMIFFLSKKIIEIFYIICYISKHFS